MNASKSFGSWVKSTKSFANVNSKCTSDRLYRTILHLSAKPRRGPPRVIELSVLRQWNNHRDKSAIGSRLYSRGEIDASPFLFDFPADKVGILFAIQPRLVNRSDRNVIISRNFLRRPSRGCHRPNNVTRSQSPPTNIELFSPRLRLADQMNPWRHIDFNEFRGGWNNSFGNPVYRFFRIRERNIR